MILPLYYSSPAWKSFKLPTPNTAFLTVTEFLSFQPTFLKPRNLLMGETKNITTNPVGTAQRSYPNEGHPCVGETEK